MRKLFGLIVILLGIGFLLEAMDIAGAENIIATWWPLLIIGIGVMSWYSNRRIWFGPMIIILVGLAMLLDTLDYFDASAWNYFWPIVLIAIGIRLVMGKQWGKDTAETTGDANAFVGFSGLEKKVSGTFTKGEVSAWFGGAKIDLRNADIQDQSTLDVFAGFGGIDILVPKNVRVVTKVMPLFGGAEDKTQPENPTITLNVSGTAMFGGIGIKN
ncbi:MAG: hypothetical protein HZC01_01095 [Candidatus Kerfeldbacteria bacterium]|nr:hypothetical protein [Candidatus Kerfeldbacteria bacterium]